VNGKVVYDGTFKDDMYQGTGIEYNGSVVPILGDINPKNLTSIGEHWTKYEGDFKTDSKLYLYFPQNAMASVHCY